MDLKKVRPYVLSAVIALPLPLLSQVPDMPTSAAGVPLSDTPSHPNNQTSPGAATTSRTTQDSSQNGSVTNDIQGTKDKMFVRHTSEGGFAEVQFGHLAVQKASNDEVKKLGQKLVDDHTALNEDFKNVSDEMGVPPPTKLSKMDQEEYDKLSALTGSDFDKEYLAFILKNHRQDLHSFRMEQKSSRDPELQFALLDGTKMIAEHLILVNRLALANGVPGAYKQQAPPVAAAPVPPPPVQ